jgi:predicted ester cyclase
MSETSAGAIIGTLRLNITDFEENIAKAQAMADKLDTKNVDVKVKADTAGAETKLAAVAASEDKVSKSSGGASGGLASVESAARKLADASSVAHIAQLRLSEVQGSGTAKASALASAHQSVTKADRDLSNMMKSSTPEVIRAADAMKQVDDSNTKVAKSSKDAGRGMGALGTAIITLGPALVPLAAATVGLAAGFGGMGTAGIFAVVGISKEMKTGSTVGVAYTTMLGTLKGDLNTLSKTAATGVLQPFQASVKDLQTRMPGLNGVIGEFSVITGKTAGTLVTGLVAGFMAFAPLARDAGVYVLNLSQRFAALMSGPGAVSFGDYIRSVFPMVMADFENIVGAALRLIAALAPLGGGTLGMLSAFSSLINAMPVDVLSTLATTAASVYVGFKTFGLLSGGITAVATALRACGVAADAASVGMRGLNIAAGAIGAIITIAMLAFSAHSESVRKDQDAVNSLTDALIRNKGAIDAQAVSEQANKLAKDGTLQAAKDAGYALDAVTLASLGNAGATALVNAHTKELNDSLKIGAGYNGNYTVAQLATGKAMDTVVAATKNGVSQLDLAKQAYDAYNAATAKAATGGNAQAIAQQAVARTAGTTVAALAGATAGQQATRDAAADAAAKMFVENNAAGILKASLDALNGKAISAAQAQNSFDSSLSNMGTHVSTTGKKVEFTTSSILNMSTASVALRGQLIGQVTNLQNVVEANGGLSDSTGKARAQMVTMRQQIIDNAVAHGVNRAAVTAYVDKLLAIPKKVPPTKLDVEKAAAEKNIATLQARITAIKQGKVPGIDANTAAGKAAIFALQTGITNVKQGKPPSVTANTRPGALVLAGLQAQANAIKQGKVPGMTLNTAAGREELRRLQAEILALKGKNIVVTTTLFGQRVAQGPGGQGGTTKAAGGYISGEGSGTSDSIPAYLSNGEYVINAAQTARYGALLEAINAGTYAKGGEVTRQAAYALASGGPVGINISLPKISAVQAALNAAPPMGGTGGGGGSGGLSGGTSGSNQAMGLAMMLAHGWGMDQWPALKALWTRESGWSSTIRNTGSGAAGIPQDITGNMHGGARGQIAWGLNYISGRYGSPAGAWAHSQSTNPHWYARGGPVGRIRGIAKGGYALAAGGPLTPLAPISASTQFNLLMKELA